MNALDYIWINPETGYREVKTSKYLQKAFEALGYELTLAGYGPLKNAPAMQKLTRDALSEVLPEFEVDLLCSDDVDSGSTDMGDPSCIIPGVHPICLARKVLTTAQTTVSQTPNWLASVPPSGRLV